MVLDAETQNMVYTLLEGRNSDVLFVFKDLVSWFEEQTDEAFLLVRRCPDL